MDLVEGDVFYTLVYKDFDISLPEISEADRLTKIVSHKLNSTKTLLQKPICQSIFSEGIDLLKANCGGHQGIYL